MARFNIPSAKDPLIYKISDFLGIDLVTDEKIDRRAVDTINFTNEYGLIKKRYPLKVMKQFIKLLDCFRYNNDHVLFIYRDRLLTDENKEYWRFAYADDFQGTNLTTIKTVTTMFGLSFDYKKIKFGDQWLLTFGNLNNVVSGTPQSTIPPHLFKDETSLTVLDPYVPTTTISRFPDGTGGTSNEDINLLTPLRKTSYWCKTAETVFYLESGTMTNDTVTAEILQSNGTYTTITEGTGLTIDRTNNKATFTVSPGITPQDGHDNVIIKYGIALVGTQRTTQPKDFIVYGYESSDRLFVNLGTNTDMYSASNDCTYFPSNNYQAIGSTSHITGYAVINNRLITFKDDLNSVWIRTGYLIDSEEVFPTDRTMSQQQIIKVTSYNNRTVVLTKMGIYEIVVGTTINFYERSMYIKSIFTDPQTVGGYDIYWFENSIYLIKNGILYQGVINFKTTTTFDEDYQWEWYKFDMPVVGRLFVDIEYVDDKTIYSLFMLSNNYLVKFNSQATHDKYIDDVPHIDYYDWNSTTRPVMWVDKQPINSYWETPHVRVSKRFDKSFTIKNFYLQTKSLLGDRFNFGYITPSGVKQLKSYEHKTARTFPTLIDIKTGVKNKAWIKFYIQNVVKYNQIHVTNLWKLISNTNDTFGGNNGVGTDVTFDTDSGCLFNGSTSKIVLTDNVQLGPQFSYVSRINIYPKFTLGFHLNVQDLTLNQKCYLLQSSTSEYLRRYELYLTKTDTTLTLTLDLYLDEIVGPGSLTSMTKSIELPYDFTEGKIELTQGYVTGGKTGLTVHMKVYNDTTVIEGDCFTGQTPLYVDPSTTMTIGNQFKGYIKNLFFIQKEVTVIDYDTLDTATFNDVDTTNQYDVNFDEIQVKWKYSGKYKGD